jgi:Pyridoxamine 5'-phosphate oxidase
MVSWSEFANAEPALAASIRRAFHQYGPGLGYLATIRPDGGPRVHPVAPSVTDEGLYCCLLDTPKRRDLQRDGRYALHAFPPEDSDDEATVRGRAIRVTDQATIQRLAHELRAKPGVDWWLYELSVETAIFVHRASGVARPYRLWRPPPAAN